MNKKVVIGVIFVMVLTLFVTSCDSTKYDGFATCLTESGAKVYGAYWCGACKAQKNQFGDSFKNVNYIECSLPNNGGQTAVCQQAGIQSYPTWQFADGSTEAKVYTLQELSEKTGCQLP